jgi:YggT family protein
MERADKASACHPRFTRAPRIKNSKRKDPKMFGDIAHFLLNTLFTLFGAALLLRAWMQAVRMPPYHPVSKAIFQATNWLVLPLRRVFPSKRSIDWASLAATVIAAIIYVASMVAMTGADPLSLAPVLLLVALLTVIKWALNLIIWLTILMALLSWLNPRSPAMPILYQLTAPFLNPLRRFVPQLSGIDLSPILLFVIVQILLMIVTRAAISLTLFGI